MQKLVGSFLIASALVLVGIKIPNSLEFSPPIFEVTPSHEIEIKATSGTWTIPIQGSGKTIKEAKTTIVNGKGLLKKALLEEGFDEKEISDNYQDIVEESSSDRSNLFHVTSVVKVRTNQVEKLYQYQPHNFWEKLIGLNIKVKEFTKPIFFLEPLKDSENNTTEILFKEAKIAIEVKSKLLGFKVIKPRYNYFACAVKPINGSTEEYVEFSHSGLEDLSFDTPYLIVRYKLHANFEVKY